MTSKQETLTVLFVDISGSTQLYETLGDTQARDMTGHCTSFLMQAITDNDGTVIKTIGDEVMSTFPNPDVALSVAIQMQSKVREEFSGLSVNLKVHIGIHFGTLLLEKGDVFGDSVNVAARMVHLAAAGEILTTRATVEALAEPSAFNIRKLGGLPVKGKQDKVDVYEILWEADIIITVFPTPAPPNKPILPPFA